MTSAEPTFRCPSCGETKQLRGQRDDDLVHVTCQACQHRWTHDPWKCPRCGERMYTVRKPLLQKARGTQVSIIGFATAKACPRCTPPQEEEGWLSAT